MSQLGITASTELRAPALISVREAFYAIQGEGARAGEPSVFVRVAGCNLDCWFCDTDWQHGDKFTVDDVVALVARVSDPHLPRWVTLTGGEPCAAPAFDDLVAALRNAEYFVSVETNGTRWREGLRSCHVVVSPKGKWEGAKAALDPKLAQLDKMPRPPVGWAREFKLVIEADDTWDRVMAEVAALPFQPTHFFLQPRYDDRRAWETAYRLCLAHPEFRLSLQIHKWLGVR
jgi:7-carboxy-7-deazaguanine synthase